MAVAEVLAELGGLATRALLVDRCGRGLVDRALGSGEVVAVGRGRYALPVVDEGARSAHALAGVLCLTSAALHHGWEVKESPDKPHVIIPKKRKVSPARRAGVHLHRADLHPDDIDGIATSIELTLTQCLRRLPFDAALAVADSALRHEVPPSVLKRVALSVRGPGSPQVRRVVRLASADKANPFESALHAITAGVPGLRVVPQLLVSSKRQQVHPDLVDADLGIAIEADSFEWHGDRAALKRDARRYNLLVVDGWLVLRFTWEDVMFDPQFVHDVLVAAVALVQGRTQVTSLRPRSA